MISRVPKVLRVPKVPGDALARSIGLPQATAMVFGASICAELSSAFPQTGGVYVFLRRLFSPAVGFLWGWAMFWSMHSGIIAAIATVFARYAAVFVPMNPWQLRMVAVA